MNAIGVWVVRLMWHTSIATDNFPHRRVPQPLEPGEVFCSDACEKLHSGGHDQKVDNWKDEKKRKLSLLMQWWCRLYVLWQNAMVPDLSLPSRTSYSLRRTHLDYLKNVRNSKLSNTIFESVLWTFVPLQMQKVWKTWCFLVGLVISSKENLKNCMEP